MPRWLSQASQALGRRPSNVPVPFELPCVCGGRVVGLRREDHQQLTCKQCGTLVFILPLDVYPQPKPKRSRSQKKKKQGDGNATDVADESVVRPRVRDRVRNQARSARERVKKARTRAKGIAIRVARRQREFVTPVRWVVSAVLVCMAAPGAWVVRQNRAGSAEETPNSAPERGYDALRRGDFTTAATEFEEACAALDLLAREDSRAPHLRQMLREATAASRLATASLVDILQDADPESAPPDDDGNQVERSFGPRYRESWIVMEAILQRVPSLDGESRLQIDYPLMAGDLPVSIDAELPAFHQLPHFDDSREVIFAAQLKSDRLSGPKKDRWLISLQPESAFLWTDADNLRALGFEEDRVNSRDRQQRILAEQSQLLEVFPP